MPIREYKCNHCGRTFESLELSSKDHPPCCPDCGSEQINPVMSAGSFRIDGQFSCGKPTPTKAKEGKTRQ
jgi:putative FmdB family regulatory protein